MCNVKPLRLNIRREDSYRDIKRRLKNAEIRLLRGCISRIKKDDMIYLSHGKETIVIYVDRLKIFPDFESMLENELVKSAASSTKLSRSFYEQFYDKSEMDKYDVVAIFFRLG